MTVAELIKALEIAPDENARVMVDIFSQGGHYPGLVAIDMVTVVGASGPVIRVSA